jgi:hypothetical protein
MHHEGNVKAHVNKISLRTGLDSSTVLLCSETETPMVIDFA